ncbi:hypothetical protein TNIN_208931 [Trichonephila inaurata madagascariensis]|uniref:Uncharacterized protein n=1 Tax=Trichonephila inaurata madagascariensis TaxID=2747483 RepID=A0A8X6MFY7_9ARAC|nr:hypothetical protein TNIN_208931 [Trichonephila inaurata madagascariensis]
MARRLKNLEGHTLRGRLLKRSLGKDWTGQIAFVGVYGVGRNTLCERFGRLSEGDIKRRERRAYRELIIDHSKVRTKYANQGKTCLTMHVIFPQDGVERDYNKIAEKLNGIVLMIDLNEDETELVFAKQLLAKLMTSCEDQPPCILVGNKKDICIAVDRSYEGNYRVRNYYKGGEEMASSIGAERYFECSAKKGLFCFPLAVYVLENFIQNPEP